MLSWNWRCRDGELDVVATDAARLVVCEVKTRSGTHFGEPAEAVTSPEGGADPPRAAGVARGAPRPVVRDPVRRAGRARRAGADQAACGITRRRSDLERGARADLVGGAAGRRGPWWRSRPTSGRPAAACISSACPTPRCSASRRTACAPPWSIRVAWPMSERVVLGALAGHAAQGRQRGSTSAALRWCASGGVLALAAGPPLEQAALERHGAGRWSWRVDGTAGSGVSGRGCRTWSLPRPSTARGGRGGRCPMPPLSEAELVDLGIDVSGWPDPVAVRLDGSAGVARGGRRAAAPTAGCAPPRALPAGEAVRTGPTSRDSLGQGRATPGGRSRSRPPAATTCCSSGYPAPARRCSPSGSSGCCPS